jgi:hypothetical protein
MRIKKELPQHKSLQCMQLNKKPGNSESQGGGGLKPFPGAIGSEYACAAANAFQGEGAPASVPAARPDCSGSMSAGNRHVSLLIRRLADVD